MWAVRLTDKQRQALRALLAEQEHLGPALSRSMEALELARWDNLPEAELPWTEVTREAADQGVSEADVVWDLCGMRARHRPESAKRTGERARRARSQ